MKIRNLILPPGGSNGYLLLGCMIYLIEKKMLTDLKFIRGTSIGAVLAFLHLLECEPTEIVTCSAEMKDIFSIRNFNLEQSLEKAGVIDVNLITNILERVSRQHGYINITFQELYLSTGVELSIKATKFEIPDFPSIDYNYKTFPNMLVVEAIRDSIFIPGLFFDSKSPDNRLKCIDGAFSEPFSVDNLPDGNSVALYIYKTASNSKIGDIILAHEIPIIKLRQISLSESIANFELFTIAIGTKNSDVTGVTLDTSDKLKLLFDGYLAVRNWHLKENFSKSKQD